MGVVALVVAPGPAFAHVAVAGAGSLLATGLWFTLAAFYAAGIGRLWRRAGVGRGVGPARVAAFAAGWGALGVALVSPLDAAGDTSLAAHMAQHMLLLAVAPPLLLAGLPAAVLPRVLPARVARGAARVWGVVGGLNAAVMAQAVVLWGWHAPAAVAWSLRVDAAHWAMHASFIVAGVWFWHALWRSARGGVAIAATMAHMGLLAALLTLSPRAWYTDYPALADQQLAGLIMWVPGSVPYLVGGLALAAAWLRGADRSVADRTYKARGGS